MRKQQVNSPSLARIIQLLLRSHRIRNLTVPSDFPHGLAVELNRLDIHVRPRKGPFFPEREIKTSGENNGRMTGFFHATGHGLGLDIHEAPRLGATSRNILRAGNVVTVEPGLYYPELGGIRLEDVVLVTPTRPRNLTKFEKVLEL